MMGLLTDRRNMDEVVTDNGHPPQNNIAPAEPNPQNQKISLPVAPDQYGPMSISLATLLDYAVQRTYHELNILTELLPRKNDSERKISIAVFVSSTRTMFLKLYALVRWLKTGRKGDQLNNINHFLDQVSGFFIETADRFVQISREELVFSRLPVFQIQTAVDALALGKMIRLPTAIKKDGALASALTTQQKISTLRRLQQMIHYRLGVESNSIPAGIHSVECRNGMAIFTAEGEFELKMTLMRTQVESSEKEKEFELWQWTVLSLKILIDDPELGGGSGLVHPFHIERLREFCQSRIRNKDDDLTRVYDVLHDFCMKLQLDIYVCQAENLAQTICPTFIAVENYDAKKGELCLVYWMNATKERRPGSTPYRIYITRDREQQSNGLKMRHLPHSHELPTFDYFDGHIPLRSVVNPTLHLRTKQLLEQLKDTFAQVETVDKFRLEMVGKSILRLSYRLLDLPDALPSEMLEVGVDQFSGAFICSVSALADNDKESVVELEKMLNGAASALTVPKLTKAIQNIQSALLSQRFTQLFTGAQLNPLPVEAAAYLFEGINTIPQRRIYFQFVHRPSHYLVVAFDSTPKTVDMWPRFYVADCYTPLPEISEVNLSEIINVASTSVEQQPIKMEVDEVPTTSARSSQLRVAMNSIADKLLLYRVAAELEKHGLTVSEIEQEPVIGGYVLRITGAPTIDDIANSKFFDNLISCKLRMDQSRRQHVWPFECTLAALPLEPNFSAFADGRVSNSTTTLQDITGLPGASSASIAEHIVMRLRCYANMFDVASNFREAYETYFHHHCNIAAYSFSKLTIAYGAERNQLVTISWKGGPSQQNTGFHINFGQGISRKTYSSTTDWNPHRIIAGIAREIFNLNPDLVVLLNQLIHTDRSLAAICAYDQTRLQTLRYFNQLIMAEEQRQNKAAADANAEEKSSSSSRNQKSEDSAFPVEMKSYLVAVSPEHIRLCYGVAHVDFYLLAENRAMVAAHRLGDIVRRDYRDNNIGLPFFKAFWAEMSDRRCVDVSSMPPQQRIGRRTANGPGSVPESPQPDADFAPFPRSCPPQMSAEEVFREQQSEQPNQPSASLILEADALRKAMQIPDAEANGQANGAKISRSRSPIDLYLHAVTYIARLTPCMEAYTRAASSNSRIHAPITILHSTPDALELRAPGENGASTNWQLQLRVFLCPHEFRLRCQLQFMNVYPSSEEVAVFVEYFETIVAPLANEVGFLQFVRICRFAPANFASVARLLQSQMNPSTDGATPHRHLSVQQTLTAVERLNKPPATTEEVKPVVVVE